jgi:enamine deaminase RidA (YjgF/YER057c/UK114 family)
MTDSQRPRREQIISPEMDNATAAKLSYAYGIRTDNIVWIAGQVARDAEGNLIGEGDAEAQAEQCFKNIRAIVEAAGGTMNDIVRMVIYLTDRAYRPALGAARARIFSEPLLPTTTLVIVAGLALPEYLVEIEAVAVLTGE